MLGGRGQILIVDDHIEMARVLAEHLADLGYTTEVHGGGQEAIVAVRTAMPDVVVTDLRMEGVDGFDILGAVKSIDPGIPVLIMTAFGAVASAVEAIKRGAFHYFTKPLELDEVAIYVERALADRQLRDENRALRRVVVERSTLGALIGGSAPMRVLYDLIERVSPSPSPVLIRGESGTGKELVARAIHFEGPRRERPFVAVNCTALPETLLESELFGHTRGAFTGAVTARRGLIVEPHGGTLFLDEIGDMTPALQAKLLRAIEDGEVRAVGADTPRNVDVRLIAATHQDLEERVRSGLSRADLFYRLNVVTVRVPPLRERRADIPALVERFLARARERNPTARVREFKPELVSALAACAWPGNVRELENVVERLVIVGGTETADVQDLRLHAPQAILTSAPLGRAWDEVVPLRILEDEYIAWAISRCGGNKTKAAELLGIDVSTIYRRERASR
jgi:two-component system response regulator HydG